MGIAGLANDSPHRSPIHRESGSVFRAGNLVDPPVDLAGRCRVANHVGGPDVFLEGVTQFRFSLFVELRA